MGTAGAVGAAGTEAAAPLLSVGGGVVGAEEHALRASRETAIPTRATFFMIMDGKEIKREMNRSEKDAPVLFPNGKHTEVHSFVGRRGAKRSTTLPTQDKADWDRWQCQLFFGVF